MIVFAREVFLCKCSTEVRGRAPDSPALAPPAADAGAAPPDAASLEFVLGGEDDLASLDPVHHGDQHLADFRARFARGEQWLIGLLGGRIATYTWLHTRPRCEYPYLPGSAFDLPSDFGYGYDAWTPPELRGSGLRRRAFVEELRVLRGMNKTWEASYFVAHQLEGARRSLARVGVDIFPLWRIALGRDRRVTCRKLAEHEGVRPVEPVETE